MQGAAAALEGVSRSFGGRPALTDVTLRIGVGESVGYLGPNGAGKTTSLKLLAGLLRPDRGRVRLFGEDPTAGGGSPLRRVGALLGTPGGVPFVHGRDWLAYVAAVKGYDGPARRAEVDRVSAELHLEGEIDRPLGGLSTGLARRLLIAASLVGDPSLLLLDEPTLGLDPVARRDLRTLLRGLRRPDRSILLSTHLLDDVAEVCDRVVFLRDGRIVGDEPVRAARAAASDRRTLRIELLEGADLARIAPRLAPGETCEPLGPSEVAVTLVGGDRRQAELVATLAEAGVPILTVRRSVDELTERYLALVGREDPA